MISKKWGLYPGVRPGDATAKFLDHIMTRLTMAGALSLTLIALFPDILLFSYNIPFNVALFFGGTWNVDYRWRALRHNASD